MKTLLATPAGRGGFYSASNETKPAPRQPPLASRDPFLDYEQRFRCVTVLELMGFHPRLSGGMQGRGFPVAGSPSVSP
jgi:hypothetical protein